MDVKHGELEDLFERYRDVQDLAALAKLFDLAAPELMRLAAHMAPDLASAEDLVQQTFLAAIEKPKAYRAGEPLLAWLFGILANQAKKSKRNARRTPEVDRLHQRDPEDPASPALSEETRAAVQDALERVPELYREVLRASLIDEKAPQTIARELDRAPGTVRMQLMRGIELLRRALPAGLAGGGLFVLGGTRGEAAIKSAVLEKAAAHKALVAGSAALTTPTLTLGGILVSTKALIAVLALVVTLCGWFLWPGTPSASFATNQQGEILRSQPLESAHVETVKAETVSADEHVDTRSAVEPPPAAAAPIAQGKPGLWLVGQVSGVAPEHATEVDFNVTVKDRGKARGKARADGSFEIELESLRGAQKSGPDPSGVQREFRAAAKPAPGQATEIEIWTRHPRYLSERELVIANDLFRELAPGERREIRRDIRLRPAAVFAGRVIVPQGWRVEDADVHVEPAANDHTDALLFDAEHAGCDAEGRFQIKSMRHGELLLRAELPGLLSTAVRCTIEPGGVLELPDFVLEEGPCVITGRVSVPQSLLHSVNPFESFGVAHGHFGRLSFGDRLQVTAHRVDAIASTAPPGALGGTVLDKNSARSVREVRGGSPVISQNCEAEGDGSFRLRGLEPGRWELTLEGLAGQAMLPLAEKTIVEAPASGVVLGEELGSIVANVVDSKGAVAGALVTIGDGETFSTFVADKDGRVQVVGDLRKSYTLSAGASGRDHASLELPAAVRTREASYELRLADAPPAATLELLPVAAAPPKSVQVHLEPLEGNDAPSRNERLSLAKGRYTLTNILPGRWKASIGPSEEQIPVAFYGDYLIGEVFELALAPGAKSERTLRCERGGRLRLTLEADESLKSQHFACTLIHPDGTTSENPVFVIAISGEGFGMFGADSQLRIVAERTQTALQDCLPPGRYELRAKTQTLRVEPLVFEIQTDETTQAVWKIGK